MKQQQSTSHKIKDIEIDKRQYSIFLIIILSLSNVILLGLVIFMMVSLKKWYWCLIDSLLFAYCVWSSFRIVIKSKNKSIYELYNDKLVMESLTIATTIDLKYIYNIVCKKTWLDILCNKDTSTLIIFTTAKFGEKIKLNLIKEDPEKLKNQILHLATKTKE